MAVDAAEDRKATHVRALDGDLMIDERSKRQLPSDRLGPEHRAVFVDADILHKIS